MFTSFLSNVATAFLIPRLQTPGGTATFQILLVNAVLYTFGLLGVHMMIFEDMTYELRRDKERVAQVLKSRFRRLAVQRGRFRSSLQIALASYALLVSRAESAVR